MVMILKEKEKRAWYRKEYERWANWLVWIGVALYIASAWLIIINQVWGTRVVMIAFMLLASSVTLALVDRHEKKLSEK